LLKLPDHVRRNPIEVANPEIAKRTAFTHVSDRLCADIPTLRKALGVIRPVFCGNGGHPPISPKP